MSASPCEPGCGGESLLGGAFFGRLLDPLNPFIILPPLLPSLPPSGDDHHHGGHVSVTFEDQIDGPSTAVIPEGKEGGHH